MVDKKEQWNEKEYSSEDMDEEQFEYDDSSEEEAAEEDDSSDEEYEDYADDDFKPKSSGASGLFKIIILLAVIGVIAFFGFTQYQKMNSNNSDNASSNIANNEQVVNEENATGSSEEVAENFFKEAGGDNENMMSVNFNNEGNTNVTSENSENSEGGSVATVSEANTGEGASQNDLFGEQNNTQQTNVKNEQTENKNQIVVSYNGSSRLNPFKPFEIAFEQKKMEEAKEEAETLANIPFEIIEPPTTSVPDEHITSLLGTQISGILYDDESPSAIVNINGQDQFVKVGDTISGYKIQSISKDKVQIAYGNNSYVASVGELFTKGKLEESASVDNLQNKFAGRYKKK